MPIREYMCRDCGHIQEEIIAGMAPKTIPCNHCEDAKADLLPSAHGGYYIKGNNSASVRPKDAGSKRRQG